MSDPVIERVWLRQVNLPPKVVRTDAIQSFVTQETVLLTVQVPDEPYVPPNARAEVKQTFPGKGILIAGCIVREGRVTRGSRVRLIRGGATVATDVVESLRRFRDDVREVKEGQECGIGLGPAIVVQEGDILEIVGEQSTRRQL